MNKTHLVGASLLALSFCFGWMTACSSTSNDSCTIGKESCACTNGGACDPGLVCLSSRCVSMPGGASGSTGTQSSTSSTTTSMTTGQGGAPTTATSTTTSPTTTSGGGAGGAPTTT